MTKASHPLTLQQIQIQWHLLRPLSHHSWPKTRFTEDCNSDFGEWKHTGWGSHTIYEGSQQSFLTEKLANLLEVVPHSSEHTSLTSFGSTQPLLRRLDNVIVNLKTSTGHLMPISVLVVPNIATPLNNTIRTTLSNVPYLKWLPLAHPVSSAETSRYLYLLEQISTGISLATMLSGVVVLQLLVLDWGMYCLDHYQYLNPPTLYQASWMLLWAMILMHKSYKDFGKWKMLGSLPNLQTRLS